MELDVPILFLVNEHKDPDHNWWKLLLLQAAPEEVGKIGTRESLLDIKKAAECGRPPELVVLGHTVQ